jgi:hypothetical protein
MRFDALLKKIEPAERREKTWIRIQWDKLAP